ncbi:MAG TPA: energy transducer TonB [Pyrinomonadaceae bacterium]
MSERRLAVAVLDFGETVTGRLASQKIAENLKSDRRLSVQDQDLARAAARGAGYAGSINLSLEDGRHLGSVLGSDFFVVGDAQTLRRSPSTGPVYFESYASLFLVSSRTGRLITWVRPAFEAATAAAAELNLMAQLSSADMKNQFTQLIGQANRIEREQRELSHTAAVPVIDEAPDDEKIAEAEGLRLPRPYRRFTPAYPESAAKAEVEATVDVLVDLDKEGEVTRVEIARWAGFGLDESTIETVKRLHFFPAKRNGVSVPLRVLLRYNFRKPPR